MLAGRACEIAWGGARRVRNLGCSDEAEAGEFYSTTR